MLFAQITPPDGEPVSLAIARTHLRLEHTLDDDYVAGLIAAARQWLEAVCWRGLVLQTWELVSPAFPGDECGFELPRGNLVSIASAKYIDAFGVEQTLVAGTDYVVDTVSVPGRLRLAYGKSWPSCRRQWDAVRIRYVVGWEADDVPQPLKQALLLLVSQMYEQRSPEVTGTIVSKVAFAVEALIAPYRLVSFA